MVFVEDKLKQLIDVLNQYPTLAVAVSGGVDSMLLMYVANSFADSDVIAAHAYSPAVPSSAFKLIQSYTLNYGWTLKLLDAQELKEERYKNNPVNRCYYCKRNLYQRIAHCFNRTIASGTNLDDLSDYRPGLQAAEEYSVVHPYVKANMTKGDIYELAAYLNLQELKCLPPQPCLASRIETGISIKQTTLKFIDLLESKLKDIMQKTDTVRCRITQQGVVVELGNMPDDTLLMQIMQYVKQECEQHNYVFSGVRPYQKGSAFKSA
ncbi:hypothetical protein [Catenovulum sediminis]|uniref:Adenine nucleotide alpha hydrolase n=1 Tax=Catenovulum sediminis TaxID=1740262 RepID=A0ABV1RJE8_9ALTE|nr:hypothetical protein [Catenovulum sediminis]